jgi:hypothetical protein
MHNSHKSGRELLYFSTKIYSYCLLTASDAVKLRRNYTGTTIVRTYTKQALVFYIFYRSVLLILVS